MPRLNDFPQWVDAPAATGAEALLASSDPNETIEVWDDSDQSEGDVPF
jgi:hypothetical protein